MFVQADVGAKHAHVEPGLASEPEAGVGLVNVYEGVGLGGVVSLGVGAGVQAEGDAHLRVLAAGGHWALVEGKLVGVVVGIEKAGPDVGGRVVEIVAEVAVDEAVGGE